MSSGTETAKPVPTCVIEHAAALLGMPITNMVVFYVNGDRNSDPMPAVVRKNQGNGVLDLSIFPQGQPQVRNDIKHVDDPSFKLNPRIAREYGAWDYPPGYLPDKFPAMPQEVPAIASAILRHWCNGTSDYHVIAHRCAVSVDLVKEVMARYGVVHKS